MYLMSPEVRLAFSTHGGVALDPTGKHKLTTDMLLEQSIQLLKWFDEHVHWTPAFRECPAGDRIAALALAEGIW